MDNTKYVALSRQMGLWKQMDHVANNMANMNTAGYKSQDVMFKNYVLQSVGADGFGKEPVHFAQDFATVKDFTAGAMQHTGNTLDFAIRGDAFFAIETDNGELYTKKGQFHLDSNRMIVDSDGQPLLSENGEPFFIAPEEKEIMLSPNGDISTENGVIGRIKLVEFDDLQELKKISDSLFDNVDGNAMTMSANSTVEQGVVEKSNVNSVAEMTKMISLQRSYEFVQQMIDTEHTRLSDTIQMYSQLA